MTQVAGGAEGSALAPLNPELEARVNAIELSLSSLGEALRSRDNTAVDVQASELHHALSRAVDHFALAARSGPIPPALRRRLATASGQVAAQRESLARATAALDRAIDVLLPRDAAVQYSPYGNADRYTSTGVIRA